MVSQNLFQKLPDDLMQKIACEFNAAETAFLLPLDETVKDPWINSDYFSIRWMTPNYEVNLCGHATLAASHALFHKLGNKSKLLTYETRIGKVSAGRKDDEIILDFPQYDSIPLSEEEEQVCLPLIKKLVGNFCVEEVVMSNHAFKNVIVRLEDSCTRKEFESISPIDMTSFHDGSLVDAFILTLKGELQEGTPTRGLEDFNFVSRYLTPWEAGYPEDAVTGSAHSSLGPYWAKILNKKELKCRQCSRRGGDLKLVLDSNSRIQIFGNAIAVIEGTLSIP